MRRALAVLAILVCTTARGDERAESRATYIAGLLDAVQQSDAAARKAVSDYIYISDRNKCQAPVESLHVGCLVEAADRNCAGQGANPKQCNRISDVIVTNRLSEPWFVPKDVRYQIMEKHKDYRAALERELRHRYAILAAEFAISPHFPGSAADNTALATGLETFCRDLAGTRDVSWQYCVAAVVWFISTETQTL